MENLVGEPLIKMGRLSTAQYLNFGVEMPCKNYKGDDETRSDWSLWIGGSCHWQFEGPDGFLLGTDDFGPEKERRDENAKPFYSRLNNDSIVVESKQILDDGTQVLLFSQGYSLTIRMPEAVSRYSEPWRFMPRRNDFRGHLVLKEFGLIWGFRLNGPRCTRCTGLRWRRLSIKSRPGVRNRSKYTRASRSKASRWSKRQRH